MGDSKKHTNCSSDHSYHDKISGINSIAPSLQGENVWSVFVLREQFGGLDWWRTDHLRLDSKHTHDKDLKKKMVIGSRESRLATRDGNNLGPDPFLINRHSFCTAQVPTDTP